MRGKKRWYATVLFQDNHLASLFIIFQLNRMKGLNKITNKEINKELTQYSRSTHKDNYKLLKRSCLIIMENLY